MTTENIDLWSHLAFKTRSYRKNYDLVTKNENIITEYEGSISKLRIKERKLPILVGEFSFSVLNLKLGRMLEIDIEKLIKEYELEDTYKELLHVINNNDFKLNYDKIVIINTLVIHPDYRKQGVTEEFIETMYRDYYSDKTAMIVLAKPIQNNLVDNDYFLNHHKHIEVFKEIRDNEEIEKTKIPAYEYYSLDKLHDKDDIEFNELKVFAVVDRCGFTRFGETHLFIYNPDKTVVRMLMKMKKIKQLKY